MSFFFQTFFFSLSSDRIDLVFDITEFELGEVALGFLSHVYQFECVDGFNLSFLQNRFDPGLDLAHQTVSLLEGICRCGDDLFADLPQFGVARIRCHPIDIAKRRFVADHALFPLAVFKVPAVFFGFFDKLLL